MKPAIAINKIDRVYIFRWTLSERDKIHSDRA